MVSVWLGVFVVFAVILVALFVFLPSLKRDRDERVSGTHDASEHDAAPSTEKGWDRDAVAEQGVRHGDDEPSEESKPSEKDSSGMSVDSEAITQEKPKVGGQERVLVNAAAVTDVGLRRTNNEDAFAAMYEHNVYAIADGMGSQAAGEVASKLTIEAITDAVKHNLFMDSSYDPDDDESVGQRLTRIVERANRVVLAMSNDIPDFKGMGTTVVLAQFSQNKHVVHIAHVGDSRCYRIRDREITQLTTDHTLGNLGIRGKTSSMLARAVGIEPNIQVDITRDHPSIGDVYLLCSDGLSGMANDEDILKTVLDHEDLDETASALIELAKQGGGKDNVTIVLVRVDSAE